MYKSLTQIAAIICAALVGIFASLFVSEKTNMKTYLDASNFVESDESKAFNGNNPNKFKNNVENSFLATSLDNYGLYHYDSSKGFEMKSKDFDGNLDSYDKVTNDAISVSLWKRDFAVVNLVIKTKKGFEKDDKTNKKPDKLNIRFEDSVGSSATNAKNDSKLKIQSGYVRYIAASNNPSDTDIAFNAGTTEPLWVPDAITDYKSINMKNDFVYVYRVRIDRDFDDKYNDNEKLKISITDPENNLVRDEKEINILKVNKALPDTNNNGSSLQPSYGILNYPNALASFYNESFKDKYGEYPAKVENPNFDLGNAVDFVDWNWEKYWKPEFKRHLDEFGEDSYFDMELSRFDDRNSKKWKIDGNGKYDPNTPYQYTDLWEETNSKYESWLLLKVKGDDIVTEGDSPDWAPFDDYALKMRNLGYKNMLLDDFVLWGDQWGRCYEVWNADSKKWEFKVIHFKDSSRHFKETYLEAWANHIIYLENAKDYKYNWIKGTDDKKDDVQASLYFDEPNLQVAADWIHIINDVVKKEKPRFHDIGRFFKTYCAIKFVNLSPVSFAMNLPEEIRNCDVLYVNSQSFFNPGNTKFNTLIRNRNSKGLITGQYQLDSHSDYDLVRAEPGQLLYEMMVLNKKKEPHYMKYMMSGWDGFKSYYSADVQTLSAGTATWEYPSFSGINGLNAYMFTDPKFEIKNDPSVRLENLALGVNLVKKVNMLGLEKANKYIVPLLTGSRIQSANKFNFKQNDIKISVPSDGDDPSYIELHMKQMNSKYGEVDAVKEIEWLVNREVGVEL